LAQPLQAPRAGDAIANALDHLVDVGLIVLVATVVLWTGATSIVVVRARRTDRTNLAAKRFPPHSALAPAVTQPSDWRTGSPSQRMGK
jgi:hypothetical protein